jgi:hypothetical protein
MNVRRYHGFVGADPNDPPPACVRLTVTTPVGWLDHPCTNTYAALCERE